MYFVKSGALALVTMGLTPSFLRRIVTRMELPRAQKGKVLICLFQRGAADALNVVVPHGERAYYAAAPEHRDPPARTPAAAGAVRPSISMASSGCIPRSRRSSRSGIAGMLAPIHAVGSPSSTRSHFDAQDYMESGTPDVKGTPDGWLNRYLATKGTCAECAYRRTPFRAVALAQQTPRILEGPAPAIAMTSLDEFAVRAAGCDVAAPRGAVSHRLRAI